MITERIEWEFESAPVREQLRLRSLRGSDKVHDFERAILDRRPDADETVEDVMQALQDLSTCRQIGMALGPIPITFIWSYWERKSYDAVAVEIMTRATLDADSSYLAQRAKKVAS